MKNEISTYEQQAIDFLAATNTAFKAEFLEFGYHFDGDKQKRNIFKITLSNDSHKYSFKFGASINDSCEEIQFPITDVADKIEVFAGLQFGRENPIMVGEKFTLTRADNFEISDATITNLADKMLLDYNRQAKDYNEKISKKYTSQYCKSNGLYKNLKNNNGEFMQAIQKSIRRELSKTSTGFTKKENIKYPTVYDVLSCLEKYPVYDFADFCANFGYDEDSRAAYKTYKAVKRESENVQKLFTPEQIELLQEIQ